MGGGDSLYDKIDKGVRGCKVVVSCVTTKYSLSANCRREVSLADALKKPIIPLLLEQMTWPPEGPMSMPFTQLLYINFCKPDIEIQNHWKVPQFDELVEKVKGYVPEVDFLIESEMKKAETKQEKEKKGSKIPMSKQGVSTKKETMQASPGSQAKSTSEETKSATVAADKKKQILAKTNKDSDKKVTTQKEKTTSSQAKEEKKQTVSQETKQEESNVQEETNNAPPPKMKPVHVTPDKKKSSTCNLI